MCHRCMYLEPCLIFKGKNTNFIVHFFLFVLFNGVKRSVLNNLYLTINLNKKKGNQNCCFLGKTNTISYISIENKTKYLKLINIFEIHTPCKCNGNLIHINILENFMSVNACTYYLFHKHCAKNQCFQNICQSVSLVLCTTAAHSNASQNDRTS